MGEKLLTLREVATRLRVSERSVFRYIHSKRLMATKVGYWRIKEADLQKFLKENSNLRKRR
ncbi:MAG: helix-turn-helix domain-containing protein [Candidatus Pacebacteria bacterium]|nr:helix-turn-helix domain-containing protein [Candidatus Paceibacterota bacterium]